MRIAYFDCFCGAAGDMINAALLDAEAVTTGPLGSSAAGTGGRGTDDRSGHGAEGAGAWDAAEMQRTVAALKLPGVTVGVEKVKRGGVAASYFRVDVAPEGQKKHRHLPEILRIIDAAEVGDRVKRDAKAVFGRLGEAEAKVHGTTIEKVHFHEVGAADAIVDIVCACAGLAALGVERIVCSPIPTGSGTVACDHGVMPIPAPATANLLTGVPLAACDEPGELTTPTGAAILTTLATGFGPLPAMQIERVGYGAGTREGRTRPNVLRVLLGEAQELPGGDAGQDAKEQDVVCVLEAQLDDLSGQAVAFSCEQALQAGALDVFTTPITMKKGRPGQLVTVLCRPEDRGALEALLLRETSTFGVRRSECLRSKLAREHVTVATRYGAIRVKVGRRGGQVLQAAPEYDDCAAAARAAGASLRQVQQAAIDAYSALANA